MRSEYIGPYGKFHYENTPTWWFEDLHSRMKDILDRETTYMRKKWNEKIYSKWVDVYDRFLSYARNEPKNMLDGPVTWYHNQCLASPSLFALSYVEPDNGKPLFLAPWQYEFILDCEKYTDIAGLMSRKLGKCISARTKIFSEKKNRFVPVSEFINGDSTLSVKQPLQYCVRYNRFNKDFCPDIVVSNDIQVWKEPEKDLYRITLMTGDWIEVSSDHRLLYKKKDWNRTKEWGTIDGGEIEEGSYLFIPRKFGCFGKRDEVDKAKLLAYFFAEGGLSSGMCDFTNTDKDIIDEFTRLIYDFDDPMYIRNNVSDRDTYCASSTIWKKNPVSEWLKDIGIFNKKAKEKTIPDYVFDLDERSLSSFLSRLFACDGYVTNGKNTKIHSKGIGICLSSEKAIWDIKELLHRFGILSSIRYKPIKLDGKKFDSWELSVRHLDMLKIFRDKIGIFIKQPVLEEIINEKDEKHNYTKQKDVFFASKITKIEYIGKEELYDVHVPKYENFIANGIISHNTEAMKVFTLRAMIDPRMRRHVRMFAPKERQLFLRDDVIRFLKHSMFFQEEYILERSSNKYERGRLTEQYVEFGRVGSTLKGAGLAQESSEGRAATGEKGTDFVIDEFGQIKQKAIDMSIMPMFADAYSDKKLIRLGTPTLDINPDMKNYWARLKDNYDIKTFSYDWVYGVKTGCIPKAYVKKIFSENLYIPCPFAQIWGICGKQQIGKDVRIDEETGFLCYPWEKGYNQCWKCDDVCKLNNSFLEEYDATFGSPSVDFWDMDIIRSSGDPTLHFIERPPNSYNPEYYLSVDFGHLTFPTQAVLAEWTGDKMVKRKHIEISPKSETRKQSKNKRYARPILKKLHDEFDIFEPYIKQYYFDITGDRYGYLSYDLVDGFDDIRGFPRRKIYRNDSVKNMKETKNVELWGIWVDGPWNSERKKDLRTAYNMGMVVNPQVEPFWSDIIWEFENCRPALTQNEQYWTFKEPKNGRRRIDLVDVDSYLTLGMDFNRRGKSKPTFIVGSYNYKRKEDKRMDKFKATW